MNPAPSLYGETVAVVKHCGLGGFPRCAFLSQSVGGETVAVAGFPLGAHSLASCADAGSHRLKELAFADCKFRRVAPLEQSAPPALRSPQWAETPNRVRLVPRPPEGRIGRSKNC